MDHQTQLMPLEINSIIPEAETVQSFASPLQFPKALQIGAHNLLGQSPELTQYKQLQFLRHSRELSGTGWIENYLKKSHARYPSRFSQSSQRKFWLLEELW